MNQVDLIVDEYTAPDMFELGSAEELTLGSCSTCADDCGCGKKS